MTELRSCYLHGDFAADARPDGLCPGCAAERGALKPNDPLDALIARLREQAAKACGLPTQTIPAGHVADWRARAPVECPHCGESFELE